MSQTALYPSVPPRTSSHQRTQTTSSSGLDAPRSPSSSRNNIKQYPSNHNAGNGGDRSRRTHQSPKTSRSTNDARNAGSPAAALPREESTIINRIVTSDPQEDIVREQARMAEAIPASGSQPAQSPGLGLVGSEGVDDSTRASSRSRHDHSKSDRPRKETRFGEYILGQTLGEGEFGKVKMGWKKEGGVQVAIKLIRREVLGSNPSRLPKIYREIAILRQLQHPNIVRLHEMVETERHIGIILEYASGGELFDYILNHRYLKDNAARRLFAQLVSGVGYLHKKGIVHRDLKLENLLLDRNRNIIITDFGFANTFNPDDELGDEIEHNLSNKEYVKKMGLDQLRDDGHRRGDLMQTSCGSPCYAAPELVVSDSLYTGRKVDVWSCGVILYAMLAGYLPFDDDPANPEGDNINLLYKYIVSTPLTFPEYVTPHARDLLRRILVPDPRKRADLFEVARHSWLSEYAHVVGFITSSTTTTSDIANTTVTSDDPFDVPVLARSASVREPSKPHQPVSPTVGGLVTKQGNIDPASEPQDKPKAQRDGKRRTVQVEYVAPQSQTTRGEASPPPAQQIPAPAPAAPVAAVATPTTRTKADYDGRNEVSPNLSTSVPQTQWMSAANPKVESLAVRPGRDAQRSISDNTAFAASPPATQVRPSTGGALGPSSRLPSRGNSYAQPVAATVAVTNAQGRFSQPKGGSGKQYVISAPMQSPGAPTEPMSIGRPSTQRLPSDYDQAAPPPAVGQRGHKRSNTVGNISEKIFGKSNSFFGPNTPPAQDPQRQKAEKRYPPTSMPAPLPSDDMPRPSTDSRRTSFGFNRKTSEAPSGTTRSSRRFSLNPFNFGGSRNKEQVPPGSAQSMSERRPSTQLPTRSRAQSRAQPPAFGQGESPSPSQSESTIPLYADERARNTPDHRFRVPAPPTGAQRTPQEAKFPVGVAYGGPEDYPAASSQPQLQNNGMGNSYQSPSQASIPRSRQGYGAPTVAQSQNGQQPQQPHGGRDRPGVLQKNRKFNDAYEHDSSHHAGSSGAAKRVMDFFRRRGKARGGDER